MGRGKRQGEGAAQGGRQVGRGRDGPNYEGPGNDKDYYTIFGSPNDYSMKRNENRIEILKKLYYIVWFNE